MYPDETPTRRVANPLDLAPPCPPLRRHRPELTREYETRLVVATCQAASERAMRVALRCGR
jgi:hypothetical protein